jgi:predicted dehydrogenase
MKLMAQNVGVAVVGVGFVGGQAHVPSFRKIPGSELVVLGARTERRVTKLSKKYNVKYCLDYDKIVDDPEVNAVVLAVPTPFHFDAAMKAMEKGKHVLCEMPLAPTIAQVKQMRNTAEKNGVVLMPVLNFRFAPAYVKTKEMIQDGVIGNPVAVHFREFIPAAALAEQWPAGSWAWDIERSGGYPDYTLSVWSIDMLRWMFESEIESVEWMSNYAKLREYGDILGYNTMGTIKFSNGIVGSLHYGASVTPSASTSRLEVYGDNTNVLHAVWNNKIIVFGSDPERREWDVPASGTKMWGHYQLDNHFIECVLHKKQPSVTVEDAIKAQEIAGKIVKNISK